MQEKTQQLGRSSIPVSAVPAHGSMVEGLKAQGGKSGALDVKTLSNNPEEHLTDPGMSDVLLRLARDKLPVLSGGEKCNSSPP